MKKIIIIGFGGNAKVIIDIININHEYEIMGILDDRLLTGETPFSYLGTLKKIASYIKEDIYFINAIGSNITRFKIDKEYGNIKYATLIHPNSIVSNTAKIGEGTVVMAGAIISTDASIGRNCIINTGAIIEHDDVIEDYSHISPGAKLGGAVHVGILSHIGIGASVKNNINIGKNTIIGAGAVVVRNIPSYCTAVGVPAKPIKYHEPYPILNI